MRILVVEDDSVLSDGLKVGLGLHGAPLDTAGERCAIEPAQPGRRSRAARRDGLGHSIASKFVECPQGQARVSAKSF
jgi:hypothetical protein